jgi:plastocyanin
VPFAVLREQSSTMHPRRNGLVLLGAALVSAACGGSSGGSVAAGSASTVQMAMNNYAFSPSVLNGTPGQKQTIHLTNSSGTEHNFTLEDQKVNKDVESGKDADVTITFPSSGQLVFVCEYHAGKGMKGTLVAGSGAASPAATDSGGGGSY